MTLLWRASPTFALKSTRMRWIFVVHHTHVCACGCKVFNLKVIFEEGEIATYFLDMECAHCGSLATAPTPEPS